MELSRKYFAQSLKLNPNNMRSLFGFYLVSDLSLFWPVLFPSQLTEFFNKCDAANIHHITEIDSK